MREGKKADYLFKALLIGTILLGFGIWAWATEFFSTITAPTSGIELVDSATRIYLQSNNLCFEDATTGAKTLAQLSIVFKYQKQTVSAAEETANAIDIDDGENYVTGDNSLKIYLNGLLLCITDDYTETDTDTISFVAGVIVENDTCVFRWTE